MAEIPGIEDDQEKEKPTESTIEDLFPDVDRPHLTAVISLLYTIGKEISSIEYIDATPYVTVDVGGETWLILNDSEADTKAQEEIAETLDNGDFDAFGEEVQWKDYIDNIDEFDNALAQKAIDYIDGIREQPGPEEGMSELDMEMAEAGMTTEEEFQVFLVNKWAPSGDAAAWYRSEYGNDAFKELAEVNTDALAQHILVVEGRGSILADEDGDEVDLGHGYFGYRLS